MDREDSLAMSKNITALNFRDSLMTKKGKTLVVSYPSVDDAEKIVDYCNVIGGESDFLTFGKNQCPFSAADEAKLIGQWRETALNLMLKGEINNRLVSILTLTRSNRPRTIHRANLGLTVLKSSWGQNIGTLMMESMVKWIKLYSNDIKKIDLEVQENNDRAIRLYEKFGFKREGVREYSNFVNGKFFSNIIMGIIFD